MAFFSNYVFSALRDFGDKTAVIDSDNGTQWTGRELLRRSLQISQHLSAQGIGSGDIVAFFSPNCAHFISFVLGISHTGAAVAFGNPNFTENELSHFLSMTSPNAIIFNPDSTIFIRDITNKSIPCFSTTEIISATSQHLLATRDSGSYEESPDGRGSQISLHKKQRVTMDIREASSALPPDDRPERHLTESSTLAPRRDLAGDPDGLAFIHLSSGTSGLPKAAMVSHRAYILMIQHGLNYEKEHQKMLAILPFYHNYGMICLMDVLCTRTSSVVTMAKFNPLEMSAKIKRYQITFLPIVPSLILPLTQSNPDDLKSLQLIMTGGSPSIHSLVTSLLSRFPKGSLEVYNIYGMTEIGIISQSNITTRMRAASESGFMGMPLKIMETKIVDPSCPSLTVPDGKFGELWLKGGTVFLGYKNNPQGTKDILDEQGWLHTGDMVYRNSEGEYFIVGRVKEMIKYQGNQVSPYELESIFRHHPDVQDVVVIGLPHEIFGELPAAVVVTKNDVRISTGKLKQFVEEQVNSSKRLRGGVGLCTADFIPRNISGKVKRKELLTKILAAVRNPNRCDLNDIVLQNTEMFRSLDGFVFQDNI